MSLDDQFRVDVDSRHFNDHFDETIEAMLRDCPVARSDVGTGYWIINRYSDVRRCGQDWRTFSNAEGFLPNRPTGMTPLLPEESDPPYHTAWRRALNPFFTPQAVGTYQAAIVEHVNTLIDAFEHRGSCDFVTEFAYPLPGLVLFRDVLGVPLEDLEYLQTAVNQSVHASTEDAASARLRLYRYLERYLASRTLAPGHGDLVDAIAAGVEVGGVAVPWADKVSVLADVVTGGLGTTAYALSGALLHLATAPEDRSRLIDNPVLIPQAVDELLRFYSPVVALARTATRDVEIQGTLIKKGETALVSYTSANRDPRVFADPNVINIDRDPNRQISFGVGPHRCIGANLALLEICTALEIFLRRIPHFSVAPNFHPTFATSIARSMLSLRLVFDVELPEQDVHTHRTDLPSSPPSTKPSA